MSKELRKKYETRNIPVRKGDEVIVMRGNFAGKKGKVTSVNIKKLRVAVEGISKTKRDGTKVNVFIPVSKVQIQSLNLDDNKRLKRIGNKEKIAKSEDKYALNKS